MSELAEKTLTVLQQLKYSKFRAEAREQRQPASARELSLEQKLESLRGQLRDIRQLDPARRLSLHFATAKNLPRIRLRPREFRAAV